MEAPIAGCLVARGLWAVLLGRKQGRLLIDPPSSPRRSIMSTVPSTSTSLSNFPSIFNAALESYKRKTKKDLAKHPLLPSLQSCNSAEDIITVLREQVPVSSESQDHGLTKWVAPTVNVIYAFSSTIGQGVGLVNITPLLEIISTLTPTFRHSHRQTQSLQGSAFSSWLVSLICCLHKLF